eukprot:TRINITY_DN7597_c0_g1_i2.p1 TRINITY_DN7597_c0_g1~~TRINITY_DN7597_c0_g1_i2.p1  ORF type:complete len:371 (+),score=118.34 TRINITY_DN7597_c0_g1_i2:57-1115(+)
MSAQGLPAHILALFTPRPPPQHLPPPVEKKKIKLGGCAEFVEFFSTDPPPEKEPWESPLERKARRHQEKVQAHKDAQKEIIAKYDPHKDENTSGDPFKTLFVGRISYDTTEKKLKREFEVFGSIKKTRMVYDQKGKPRGYAFIEFEHERDLKNAYKQGDGKKIDGRRVMVDVERGRTVEGWLPRRLGGGRGPGRVGKPSKKKQRKLAAAVDAQKEKEKEEKEERKKDKEKEKDKKDRDRDDDRKKDRDRDDDRKKDRDRDDDRKKDRDRDRDRDDDRKKERDRDDDRKKDRDRDDDDDRKKDKKEGKDKDREKEKDRDEKKDRDRDRKRERSRSRDRSKDRDEKKKKSRRDD